jgi:fluoride exporter
MARGADARHLARDFLFDVLVRAFWAVAIGAAIGGTTRYYVSLFATERLGDVLPWATLIINVTGSFVLGFLMRFALASPASSMEVRLLLATGVCGGYTTFSTYSYEVALLIEEGQYERAATYAFGSMILAVLATFAGFVLARELLAVRARP